MPLIAAYQAAKGDGVSDPFLGCAQSDNPMHLS
ncbi:hypothetical protein BSF44_37600 [Pseudomonas sp. ACN8]|nr:hypothetical protein BSF44_37600 [Pseudomonas sp. ACN8]